MIPPAASFVRSRLLSPLAEKITHAFCTRNGGVSVGAYASLNFSHKEGDREESVRLNIAIVAQELGLHPEEIFTVRQVHGEEILILAADAPPEMVGRERNGGEPAGLPECDGIITNRRRLAVGVKTADCVPILLFDPENEVIGAIHAGWRGTARGIAGKAVTTMASRFGSRREDILAAIGPAIGGCCYEVDDEVCEHLAASVISVPGWENRNDYKHFYFRSATNTGYWFCDLKGLNHQQLLQAGLTADKVEVLTHCTACATETFFSHRRDGGKTGRMMNLIALI